MYTMRHMMKYEKMRAKDLLKEIDEHNDNLIERKDNDAMAEIRSELANIATGRKYFTPLNPSLRRA